MSRRDVSNARLSPLQRGRRAARRWPWTALVIAVLLLLAVVLLVAVA